MNRFISRARSRLQDDAGITLIEMVVSISIVALVFMGLALVLAGALNAYATARLRSAFIEIGNAEIEIVRAQPFADIGVLPSHPNYGSAYPEGKFDGRDAVAVTSPSALSPVSVVTSSSIEDVTLPYTVRRWVTWTDTSGGTAHVLKRITVELEWSDRARQRTFQLVSLRYPGGLGAETSLNQSPQASFTATPSTITQGLAVSLDGTASTDPDGDSLSYDWNFGDGQTLTGAATASHVYGSSGNFTIQLTVRDGRGGSQTAMTDVTVISTGGNSPPTAEFTYAPATGIAPVTVNFDAGGSTDPNGASDITSYSWDWGDGTATGSGVTSHHTFTSVGTFSVVLTVTDRGGLTDAQAHSIVVSSQVCDISEGYLKNPESNSLTNDVKVDAGGKPDSRSFTIFATSNLQCTSLTGKVTHSNGTLSVPLVLQSSSGSIKTWKGTASVGGNDRFSLGLNQTGEIRGPRADGSDEVFPLVFNVHR